MQQNHQDIGRITLNVLFIGGLLFGCAWVMMPFLVAILWATTLVLATWPLMLAIQGKVGGRRWLAVLIMTVLVLVVLIVPIGAAVNTVVGHIDVIHDLVQQLLAMRLPPAPRWLDGIPIVGQPFADAWSRVASSELRQLLSSRIAPYAGTLTQWVGSAVGGIGSIMLQLLLSVAISVVLYSHGERAAVYALRFGRRLAKDRGERAIRLAGQAIRAVALGVVVTALLQSMIGGIGLILAGLPFVGLLSALMFMLCLVQLGPGLVLIPAVIWMYYSSDFVLATVLLAFTIVASTVDQAVRPILIRRGADLPLLLIMAGVIGGLIAFGFLGIFVGPTILAVTYTLLNAWMNESGHDAGPAAPITPAP